MAVPCDCCPMVTDSYCGTSQVLFGSVGVMDNPAGLPITNLASTIDGTAGADLSGFSPPVSEAQLTSNPTTGFDYIFAAPVDRLKRLRWYNGGGGVLTDQDGFGLITVTLLDAGLLPLFTTTWDLTAPVGDNNIVRELNFAPVNGVSRIRFDHFHKQNTAVFGTGAPLLRQVEAFTTDPVYPCRRSNGTVEWYDAVGNLVPATDVHPCVSEPSNIALLTPVTLPDLRLQGTAFGDDLSGHGENLCAIVPAPSATSGWTGPSGGCYDPTVGTPTMNWVSTSSVDITYGGSTNVSGGVFMSFSSPTLGGIQWPTNTTPMAIGEQRWSNFFGGGKLARLTYVSGPASGSNLHQNGADGGKQMFFSPNPSAQIVANMRFMIEFFTQ